jgi:FkbM family methyltransferase
MLGEVTRRRILELPPFRRFPGASSRGAPRADAQTEFWELARTMTPYVAAENRGDVYLSPTWISGALFARNVHRAEFVCLARACAFLRDRGRLDGDVFVDVGAHIGTSVIPALTQHGFARAVAIEPDPDNLVILRANLALNGLDANVTAVPAAVSAAPGRLWFVPGRQRGGWARGQLRTEPAVGSAPVDVVTLDSLVEAGDGDPAATGLLWLGKGFDDDALLAASAFLARRVPIVLVFVQGRMKEASPFLRELKERGYAYAVDLRGPSLKQPLDEWPRVLRPVDELPAITPSTKVTDMLVF